MDNQQITTSTKYINWALIAVVLASLALWVAMPQTMAAGGGGYIIIAILSTLLFYKILLLKKSRWGENVRQVRAKLPWLIYLAFMGLVVHYFLETTYWGPKRQKALQAIEEKFNTKVSE